MSIILIMTYNIVLFKSCQNKKKKQSACVILEEEASARAFDHA